MEEIRIKDARMEGIPAQRRPHYLPTERLAILELRAARRWSQAQTAEQMLVSPATIASWMGRLDEEGPAALVQMREPVNRFAVRSTRPNQIWNVDLTTIPTASGFWVPWVPWALPQRWPFCWWVGVIVDHFSRRIMGIAVFKQNPTSIAVRQMLGRAIREAGFAPSHLITDQGTQFTDGGFRRWCRRRGIRQRFGAVQKYGSISVIERLMRTMKSEALRRILVPLDRTAFRREVGLFVEWYNRHRPHSALEAATPEEIYFDRLPRPRAPRFEPRRQWPRGSPCAGLGAPVRGRRGQELTLAVTHLAGRRHLPLIKLKRAA